MTFSTVKVNSATVSVYHIGQNSRSASFCLSVYEKNATPLACIKKLGFLSDVCDVMSHPHSKQLQQVELKMLSFEL